MSTEELLNTLSRYDSKRKVKSNHKKLLRIKLEKIAKMKNTSNIELKQAEKLQNKSIDKLRGIARLRRIKNYDNLTKQDLIIIKSFKIIYLVLIIIKSVKIGKYSCRT